MVNAKTLIRIASQSLRFHWWHSRLATLGAGTDIQPTAVFEYPENIMIGKHCRIARQALLRANTGNQPGIRFGGHVSVLENVLINANRGHIVIGDHSWIGPGSIIYGNGGVNIGDDVMIASHCVINTVSHHFSRQDMPMSRQGTYCDPVIIDNDVWIGTAAIILQGVHIGRGSIIGAGAVVTRNIPPFSIAVGMPARVTGCRRDTSKHKKSINPLAGDHKMESPSCH